MPRTLVVRLRASGGAAPFDLVGDREGPDGTLVSVTANQTTMPGVSLLVPGGRPDDLASLRRAVAADEVLGEAGAEVAPAP